MIENQNLAVSRAGFVAVVGRPNSGKSTLLNHIVGEHLALVSHKANATRNKMNFIVPHITKDNQKCQIIFVDTPGIHKREKLLNQFMLEVALKAMRDCDLCVFLACVHDDIRYYEEFLALYPKKHILVLSKIDTISQKELLGEIQKYQPYGDRFFSLIPISAKKDSNIKEFLEEVSKYLPESSALFDEDDISTQSMREITKEMIRQSVFECVSDEIPYESDVLVEKFTYKPNGICEIHARIYAKKQSQKIILIGKNGETIKRIGIKARLRIQEILGSKVFLRLIVVVNKEWAKDKKNLKNFGYSFEGLQ